MKVGFVGAGRMGAPMVRRLADAGHDVIVLGRDAEKRSAIAELGARPVEELAERGRARGVAVVDAPVSGGPHDIAAGTVTVFAGGDEDAVQAVRPLLASYAEPVLHVGPTGSGQLVKLVNNTLFAAQIGIVAEAVRLAGRLGVDESTLLAALPHGSGTSRALGAIAAAGSADRFISAVGEFIGKDVAVVRATVAELGGGLGMLDDVVDAGLTHRQAR
jgi:3-hydroxyisobutyrate dehydrogenase-like beta-hydroxyacid dehydrogenase